MNANLTDLEKKKAAKIKALAQTMGDYAFLIVEDGNNPSQTIEDAINAVHYYSRLFKEME